MSTSTTYSFALPSPAQVMEYASKVGWRHIGSNAHSALFRLDENGPARQLIVPLSADLIDYPKAMRSAVACLAEVEGIPAFIAAIGIQSEGVDQVGIRCETDEPGIAYIADATALFNAARGLILSSASAAVDPRPMFGQSRPEQAEKYLNDVRVRVIHGSFVVSMACPLKPSLEADTLSVGVPYGRQVTNRLLDGVEAVLDLVKDSTHLEEGGAWAELVQHGVSAELVDALAVLAPREGDRARQVEVEFSPSLRDPRHAKHSIEVPPGFHNLLQDGARLLRRLGSAIPSRLVGEVVGLERRRNLRGAVTGKIAGRLHISGTRPRVATVRIDAPDGSEELLIEAYRARRAVEVHGSVSQRGRNYLMASVDSINLTEEHDPSLQDALFDAEEEFETLFLSTSDDTEGEV
ncbi:hypothetical protein [Parafrankia elaeagni]|uniref:hypothetical protein n=1 Tax=Parafrankia elaeagni TaxID=222534 RepID=UPI0012B58E45|nr:hypothetical protein [Parafrankia elaeagni]